MDPDDSMLSSPSSQGDETYDEDNLFPDSNADVGRPRTPQNDHLNAAAPGELSPPRSQSTNVNDDRGGANAATRSRTQQQQQQQQHQQQHVDGSDDLSPIAANRTLMPSEEEWKPGQGWKSKKAQEDMQRAWDNVVDKDFSLKDFGDVMAHLLTS